MCKKNKNGLIDSEKFFIIFNSWREWDKENSWRNYFDEFIDKDNENFIKFVKSYITKISSSTFYETITYDAFNPKNMREFYSEDSLLFRLETIVSSDKDLYKEYKYEIDLVIDSIVNPKDIFG